MTEVNSKDTTQDADFDYDDLVKVLRDIEISGEEPKGLSTKEIVELTGITEHAVYKRRKFYQDKGIIEFAGKRIERNICGDRHRVPVFKLSANWQENLQQLKDNGIL